MAYRASSGVKKVSNREIRRRAQAAINAGSRAVLILMTVLAQKGGEVVITQGTLDQCGRNLMNLDFGIFPADKSGEFVVRLLEGAQHESTETGIGQDSSLQGVGAGAGDGAGDDAVSVEEAAGSGDVVA